MLYMTILTPPILRVTGEAFLASPKAIDMGLGGVKRVCSDVAVSCRAEKTWTNWQSKVLEMVLIAPKGKDGIQVGGMQ